MRFEDLIQNIEIEEIPKLHLGNLLHLHGTLNELEYASGLMLQVTSGYRSWPHHKEVYRVINDKRLIKGLPELPIPLHSKHLSGEACDLADPDGALKAWIKKNESWSAMNNAYYERFDYTKTWVHLQTKAPGSGVRYFRPY